MAIDRGVMNSTAARLETTWWAADASVPWRAMNSAISVNDVTSTMMARPPGMPSRANCRITGQSGRSSRRQIA